MPAASSNRNKQLLSYGQGLQVNNFCFLTKTHVVIEKFSLSYKIKYSQTFSHNLIFRLDFSYPVY